MGLNLGPFARMTYGINPNFFNYVDLANRDFDFEAPRQADRLFLTPKWDTSWRAISIIKRTSPEGLWS